MLKFLKWFFGLFSSYVSSFERKTDKFFQGIKSTDNIATIREKLLSLMQENLIVVNVWLEKKFKGYTYLSKKVRRKMYEDVGAIKSKLEQEIVEKLVSIDQAKKEVELSGHEFLEVYAEKILYIYQIMHFLKPGKYYHYIKTASFGKLLRDPNVSKMEGDCNQIVTLYIYLYGLKFDISDLKIKLLPEHVCLHFNGIDIECTNGEFAHYKEDCEVLPVTEIISTNLLDLADFREDLQVISDRVMVKSAQLAYSISSHKELVMKNLEIAYQNIGVGAMKSNDFGTAVFFLGKLRDKRFLKDANHNAAIYYMKSGDFTKARYYAQQTGDSDLLKAVNHNDYAKQFNQLQDKVAGVKTIDDAKRQKYNYQKMLDLAVKMGDLSLQKSLRETLSKI